MRVGNNKIPWLSIKSFLYRNPCSYLVVACRHFLFAKAFDDSFITIRRFSNEEQANPFFHKPLFYFLNPDYSPRNLFVRNARRRQYISQCAAEDYSCGCQPENSHTLIDGY